MCTWIFPLCAGAEVRLASVFGDNAVLQREMPVPVWGKANPGESVEVSYRGQSVKTTADSDGRWRIILPAMDASGHSGELAARGDKTIARAANVVVGDVWLCSGQSNMEMPVEDAQNAKIEIAAADYPAIRDFSVPRAASETPLKEIAGSWEVCSSKTAGKFSATAYYFARDIHKRLGVPVGIINSSRGATQIESWMSEESLKNNPAFSQVFERWKTRVALVPERMEAYEEAMRRWHLAKNAEGSGAASAKPEKPEDNVIRWRPSGLYNAMIYPLTPATIRGVIWYQGETNSVRHAEYAELFQTMIKQWREAFRQPALPFYFVQLAGTVRRHDPTGEEFAWLREAQRSALRLPETGMAVTIDISDNNIHPKNKQDVGKRLASIALAGTYSVIEEYSGPLFESTKRDGVSVRIAFSHARGLHSEKEPLPGFEIAGEDLAFVPADAQIEGDHIVLSAPGVTIPMAVRYAWGNAPSVALFNNAELPASPFLHKLDTPPKKSSIRNVIVYKEPGKFAGWPANGGYWAWGNELLVCFDVGSHKPRSDNHAIDPGKPVYSGFARSLDGGETWKYEEHSNVLMPRKIDNDSYRAKSESLNFRDANFAMKFRDAVMWSSVDRGRSWHGPSWISGQKEWVFLARTNYIVTGEKSAFVFMTAREKLKETKVRYRNRSQAWRTNDGGKTFQFVSLIGEPDKFTGVSSKYDAYAIMPSALRIGKDHYICAVRELIRREKWVRIYESRDACRTWNPISDIAKGAHNPAALVLLGGLRVAAIYGSRQSGPQGIYGCISNDGGRTWEKAVPLRQDAISWDFGYPVASVREDGCIVAVYYMTTKQNPQQHIAATIWNPSDR